MDIVEKRCHACEIVIRLPAEIHTKYHVQMSKSTENHIDKGNTVLLTFNAITVSIGIGRFSSRLLLSLSFDAKRFVDIYVLFVVHELN